MRWASGNGVSPSAARHGAAGPALVMPGDAGMGAAWRGMGCDGSTEGLLAFPAAFIGGQGKAGSGKAWRGEAWQGTARATDGGTEGFGLPCHPHKGGQGAAWQGPARHGWVRKGGAGRGMGCRQQHWGLRLLLLLSLESRYGTAGPA